MKIFILDKFKITKFNLPEKVEDSFLIPYKGYDNKNETAVTVEANDDKWQLKSNGTVNVLDGNNIVDSVILEDYNYYTLKILGQDEPLTLFSLPSREEENYKLEFKNLTSITIGSSQNTNINYRNNLTAELHAEIKFINNEWYIAASSDDKYRTYINGERILTSQLNVGDVIFINGLRIIWMKTFIKINNPKQSVSVTRLSAFEELEIADNTKYTPVSDEEANIDLYDEEDYFYHMPRLVPVIEPVDINIDTPPGGQTEEEMPFLLTLGTSITMFASTGIMVYNLVRQIVNGTEFVKLIPQTVLCVSMLIGTIIMPRILKSYQKRKQKQREETRQTKYKEYLNKMDTKIQNAIKQQKQILNENNLTIKECQNIVNHKNRKLWSREILDDDFLNVRLGIGDIDSFVKVTAPQEHFSLETDNLQELVYEVDKNSKKLENAPIILNIGLQPVLSFIFNCSYKKDYINGLILQLIALHSPLDLKIVVLTNEQNKKRWEFVKYLPHCWSDDRERRFFATNSEEYKEVLADMEEIWRMRDGILNKGGSDNQLENRIQEYKNYPPYYLIITDDYKQLKNYPVMTFIQKNKKNNGMTLMTISDSLKGLPNKCERFIQIGEKESCILDKKLSSQSQTIFTNEYEKNLDLNTVSVKLSNIPLMTKDGLKTLPNSISFLDMYGVGKIEQLNIVNRWQSNNPVTSLATPIGVHKDGEQFKLDLHEKFHGPHGLIAGSTGSGKSEFIITYILSMCVNYHPYEVQFVLIDYKGGGLAGAFENKETGVKIPHLVGTITNLDTAEMNRTLVSISSELKRRQRKFNEVKDKLEESTMDIYKYQKLYREGLIDEPMAHLFIISDEFAELKSQQPEFLAELVSTARIGRSLGVHLILATQKPSGVVNDQIWSNSKFKVCLKVQDRSDSMEMLKRPEAASIKETGRFYLQVGYDDYFDIGQSGWGGAKYIPTDKIITKRDDSLVFVNNVGNVVKSINDIEKKETSVDLGDQLTNIVKYIYKLSDKDNITTKKMWLDKIPEKIYISEVKKKYNYSPRQYLINPLIGEYDNPAAQLQGILTLNLHNNVVIYGKGGSGKENLISTILWSSITEHTPDEVNFYIIDCGAETLKMFYKIPHVGEVMVQEEHDKIIDTFNMLNEEINRRKDAYADYAGSYENYCENSGNHDPLIVTIINNYDVFVETFGKLSEQIQALYRDGVKYGVTFIISCLSAGSIRGKMLQLFNEKVCLEMPNIDDYRSVLNCPRGLIPYKSFGRGLIGKDNASYEFQTASITEIKQINNVIKNAAVQLNEAYTTRAKKIPVVPDIVTLKSLEESNIKLDSIPIGYNVLTKMSYNYNFTKNKINCVVSETMAGRLDFIRALIKMFKNVHNINIKILDFVGVFETNYEGIKVYNNEFDRAIVEINNEIASENTIDMNNLYFVIGVSSFEQKLSENGKKIFTNLMMALSAVNKSNFIFVDNYSSFKALQLVDWYKSQVDNNFGIWLGPNVSNQMAFNVSNVNMDVRNINFPCMGFSIENSELTIIKYVIDMEEKNEE